jgi:hypothetical protein
VFWALLFGIVMASIGPFFLLRVLPGLCKLSKGSVKKGVSTMATWRAGFFNAILNEGRIIQHA